MDNPLPLSPRYRLDDEQPWLVGIDAIRRYWIQINGDPAVMLALPGLQAETFEAFRTAILNFRRMTAGETLSLPTATAERLCIHCVADNCFAVAGEMASDPVSHLFDRETLEALLMTAHPDWRCAPEHAQLGRRLVSLAWQQSVAETAA